LGPPTRGRQVRRAVLHAFTAGLSGAALAACGPGQGQAPVAAGPPVAVELWHPWNQRQPHSGALAALLDAFAPKHPRIQVRSSYIGGDNQLSTKLVAAVAAGTPPHVADVRFFRIPTFAAKGMLTPLRRLSVARELNPDDLLPGPRQGVSYRDQVMAWPYILTTQAFVANQPLLQEAGVAPPSNTWTWEELVALTTKATDASRQPPRWGLALPAPPNINTTIRWLPFLWQNGGDVFDRAGRRVVLASEAGAEALQFWVDLVNRHRVVPTQQVTGTANGFASGQLGLAIVWAGTVSVLAREITDFTFGAAPQPRRKREAAIVDGHLWTILAGLDEAHTQAAGRLVAWISAGEATAGFNTATTTFPPRRSVQRLGVWQTFLREHPRLTPFQHDVELARPAPLVPNWDRMGDAIGASIEAAVTQQRPARDALADAARQVEQILSEGA
jgi:multiple sugar transport system substrate-binding protein